MKKSDLHVLIVDDDKAVGKTLSEVVKRAGYKPVCVVKVDDALNFIRLRPIHAAIVDCMLPKMNGIELVKAFRQTQFGSSPVILISGIFKDKSFEQESIRKTGAAAFLQKPFSIEDLTKELDTALEHLTSDQKFDLHMLITRKLQTARERLKVIERLESITGAEVPLVLAILMESKASGFLNFVSDTGEIYGVTLAGGGLSHLDSGEAEETSIHLLQEAGYLDPQDWESFQGEKGKKAPLAKLVETGLVSPHAVKESQKKQIIQDLNRILAYPSLQISFVPDSEDQQAFDGLSMIELFRKIELSLDVQLSDEYLESFFESAMENAVEKMPSLSDDHGIWEMQLLARVPDLKTWCDQGISLKEMLETSPDGRINILKAIYMLVVFRQVLFEDANKVKSLEAQYGRARRMFEDLKTKNPFEIFAYFGAGENPRASDVEKIYKEFAKSNHPDTLPREAPNDIKEMANKTFAMVSDAHDILVDDKKREDLLVSFKKLDLEKQMKAEAIYEDGTELMRRGSYGQALEKFRQAYALFDSPRGYCLLSWATLKAKGSRLSAKEVHDIRQRLESFSIDERRTALYNLVVGLSKRAQKDPTALASFEKALSLEPNFIEARRELNATNVPSSSSAPKAMDFLTGDITSVVKGIFRKKSS